MEKLLFVYNPRSGKGLIRNNLSTIIEIFSEHDYDVTVYPTKKELDACETVQRRAVEFDRIVCCGGDGTLDEVVTGLMHSGLKKSVGYIPAGSTNDFANSIGIPKQMEQAARLAMEGERFACDLGKFNEDYFVYVAAFGMLADVSYQTPQDMKNLLGHAAYVLEGVKRMGSLRSWHLRVTSEEFTGEGDFILGMVTNSNSVGGIKGLIGRDVELNDGLFEVMLVRFPQNLLDWQTALTEVLVPDDSSRMIVRFKTKQITICSDEPLAWTRDGENGGEHTRVELVNMQQVLEIVAPGECVSEEEQPDPELPKESE